VCSRVARRAPAPEARDRRHGNGLARPEGIVHLPVTPQLMAKLLYLVRSPVVDAVIQREGWRVVPAAPHGPHGK
jgi:hypothetical protein